MAKASTTKTGAKSPKEEVEFISPEEIWARNEYIFIAKKDSIDTKIYRIDAKVVDEKESDMKISDFDVYFPKKPEILYFVLDEIVVLFGKEFSDESLATLVGILNKFDDMVVNILKPSIKKEPKWYPDYVSRIEKIAGNMECFLGTEDDKKEKAKKKK